MTTSTADELKQTVRATYARVVSTEGSSCCGPASSCCGPDRSIPVTMAEDYTQLEGYLAEADFGLGCGIPTEFANLLQGETVLDLGSGAGNDAFVARALVGESGRVIGVDMTPEMVYRARANAERLGATNVEFRLGEIEALPVADASVDVIVSNCVLNLVPEKDKAFAEMFRVLQPGGRFCVSDIVLDGALSEAVRAVAELYAGCVTGAIPLEDYLRMLEEAGFSSIQVVKDREIIIPDEQLEGLLAPADLASFRASGARVRSVTVVGTR